MDEHSQGSNNDNATPNPGIDYRDAIEKLLAMPESAALDPKFRELFAWTKRYQDESDTLAPDVIIERSEYFAPWLFNQVLKESNKGREHMANMAYNAMRATVNMFMHARGEEKMSPKYGTSIIFMIMAMSMPVDDLMLAGLVSLAKYTSRDLFKTWMRALLGDDICAGCKEYETCEFVKKDAENAYFDKIEKKIRVFLGGRDLEYATTQ